MELPDLLAISLQLYRKPIRIQEVKAGTGTGTYGRRDPARLEFGRESFLVEGRDSDPRGRINQSRSR